MLNDDLKLAEKVIKGNYFSNDFSKIYPFTNEMIKCLFDQFNFESKDVLSVLASSDQVFDIFLRGAKTIHTFDINPLTKYYFHLKKAGVQALSQEDFIAFFDIYHDSIYDRSLNLCMFNDICKFLKDDAFTFWNILFTDKDIYPYLDRLFSDNYIFFNKSTRLTLYLDKINYLKLKRTIADLEIKFINCNLKDLSNSLNANYDIMYLSNILARMGFEVFTDEKSDFNYYVSILKDLSKYLKENGVIIANYYYYKNDIRNVIKKMKKEKIDVSHFKKIFFKGEGALIYGKR